MFIAESETEDRQVAARAFVQAAMRFSGMRVPTELAKRCAVAPSTINRIMSGDTAYTLSLDTLVRISKVTNLPFTEDLISAYSLTGVIGAATQDDIAASDPELIAYVLKSCGVSAGPEGYPRLARRVSEKLIAIRALGGK